jgi:hypothetical protein
MDVNETKTKILSKFKSLDSRVVNIIADICSDFAGIYIVCSVKITKAKDRICQ